MVTRARKVDGGYRLSGAKTWISNSPIADVFVVWAKTDDGDDPRLHPGEGLEGPVAPAIHGKVGLRASITGEIVMDEVFVPEENLLARRSRGLKGPVHLPQLGALRHRLGRARRGGELLARARGSTCSTASNSAGRSPPTS